MNKYMEYIDMLSINKLVEKYPITEDFLQNINLSGLDRSKPLSEALKSFSPELLDEFGLSHHELPHQLSDFLMALMETEGDMLSVSSLTIMGGHDKRGTPEDICLTINAGEIISIVGPTGSGKSRLLADIECLAAGDTPTKRTILLDGQQPHWEERLKLESKLVAQLSQNMNFVMDLTVLEFLNMHARCRMTGMDKAKEAISLCFEYANSLSGEKFTETTKLTQLSGGQSRALMIADVAFMCRSPIVLIDEIENAGIDRNAAISLLAKRDKIVLISTHDPLLALRSNKRIVIKNGGIFRVIETTEDERQSLLQIEQFDNYLRDTRQKLRDGEQIFTRGGNIQCGSFMTN